MPQKSLLYFCGIEGSKLDQGGVTLKGADLVRVGLAFVEQVLTTK